MKDSRKWPRFKVYLVLEIAAPCRQAAEDLAQEYRTRAENDNGEERSVFPGAKEPAYVVTASALDATELTR
jgi:hypothetical protein